MNEFKNAPISTWVFRAAELLITSAIGGAFALGLTYGLIRSDLNELRLGINANAANLSAQVSQTADYRDRTDRQRQIDLSTINENQGRMITDLNIIKSCLLNNTCGKRK
jgi:hypothetical protein